MASSSYVDKLLSINYIIAFKKLKLFQIASNKFLTNQGSGMSLLPIEYANEFEAAFLVSVLSRCCSKVANICIYSRRLVPN